MKKQEPSKLEQAALMGAELMKEQEENPYREVRSEIQKLIDGGEVKERDLRREEDLARVHKAVAGLSDAGRAIANFIGTTQGVPNAYADSGLSEKARERVARARAEREKNSAALLNYQYQMGKLDENERSWKYKLRQDKIRNRNNDRRLEYLENESQRKINKQQADIDYKNKLLEYNNRRLALQEDKEKNRISVAQYNAETNRIKANTAKLKAEHNEQGFTTTTTKGYDNMGRLQTVTVVKTPNGEEYQFDADGNVLNNTASANNSTGGGKKDLPNTTKKSLPQG
jgi:hypothetical protein